MSLPSCQGLPRRTVRLGVIVMLRYLLTLTAMALVVAVAPAQDQPDEYEQVVIRAVEKLGGTAMLDPKLDEIARVATKFDKLTDEDLAVLCKLPNIGAIEVRDSSLCSVRGISLLKELPDLQTLIMGASGLGDQSAAVLGSMRTLQVLFLGESRITDVGAASLGKLKNLRVLDVFDTKLTDRAMAHFAGMEKLEDLNISGTNVTNAGLLQLKELKNLKIVRAARTNVNRNGTDALEKEIPKLVVRF